jgi:chromate transporter
MHHPIPGANYHSQQQHCFIRLRLMASCQVKLTRVYGEDFHAGCVIVDVVAGKQVSHELAIIFGGGIVASSARSLMRWGQRDGHYFFAIIQSAPITLLAPITTAAGMTAGSTVTSFGLWSLFFSFLKVGSVLFGSGYVLLAFLQADLVERWHWLTKGQLLDAIAVGHVTPGLVFTTATFIGYVLGGYPGANAATAGICPTGCRVTRA